MDEDEDMPLYEYQCEVCAHRFEKIQRFSDPPLEACPSCGGVVRKLISSPAFQFKGSGWYVTDYARTGGDATGKDSKSAADSGSEAGSGSEKSADRAASGSAPSADKPSPPKPKT